MIAFPREQALPYALKHAERIETRLETHASGEDLSTLVLNDDVYLRGYDWARVRLGIPLPVVT